MPVDSHQTSSKRGKDIKVKVEYFRHPDKLWSTQEIISDPKVVPQTRGVYGWYFNELPPQVPTQNYIQVDGCKLLYIGVAPKYPWSATTLHSRIMGKHLGNNASVSTLRMSLGTLLRKELGLSPMTRGTERNRSIWFGVQGEKELTDWMTLQTRVAWKKDEHPWEIETTAFKAYSNLLPLNIRGNKENRFRQILKSVRRNCRDEAWCR